jgi:hypothetical protein
MTTCSMPNSSIRSTTTDMPSLCCHLRLETKSGSTDAISARIALRRSWMSNAWDPFGSKRLLGKANSRATYSYHRRCVCIPSSMQAWQQAELTTGSARLVDPRAELDSNQTQACLGSAQLSSFPIRQLYRVSCISLQAVSTVTICVLHHLKWDLNREYCSWVDRHC